jgi:hypothetical protein
VGQWQFQVNYPVFAGGSDCTPTTDPARSARCQRRREDVERILGAYGDRHGRGEPALGSFLRTYQRFAYTPGPLLAAALIIALSASLGLGRARNSGLRAAAFLFGAMGLVVSISSVAVLTFSWRYTLPQLVLLPPAAAVGATALLSRRGEGPNCGRAADNAPCSKSGSAA